jgi:hypothetical protein
MMRLAIVFALAWSLCAQTPAANSGPTLGFVPGSAPWQLQPILGIPGAARLGAPLSLPNTITLLSVAPGQSYAVAIEGPNDPASLAVLRINGVLRTAPVLTPLAGALAHPDLVAFSPTGQSLALYSQHANQVQVFTGLPASPRIASQISNIDSAVKLAVSDDAQVILIADAAGNVEPLAQAGPATPLYHAPQIAALAFLPHSHDAIVCDPSAATAVLLQGGTSLKILPSPATECQAQAAAGTADGNTILIACPAQHLIWSVDRTSGVAETFRTTNSPAAFDSLAARDAFLLSPADSAGTWWIVAWQSGAPVVSFIGARP